ncbi:hypothetical protein [Schaalia sp. lx-260]|uniref:hypothetical protein n=1 Tax=Schaalia sp. lx-260 TaxID=2899082 RepID=UPI001E42DE5D|nr:hypothetical protein [Schaalia sp. lx-260]MCD4549921.1 hypothetical protein [Schaalia sp. lx-260]
MGFAVMVLSAIVGVTLILLGALKAKENKLWLFALLAGVLSFACTIWLAWPK